MGVVRNNCVEESIHFINDAMGNMSKKDGVSFLKGLGFTGVKDGKAIYEINKKIVQGTVEIPIKQEGSHVVLEHRIGKLDYFDCLIFSSEIAKKFKMSCWKTKPIESIKDYYAFLAGYDTMEGDIYPASFIYQEDLRSGRFKGTYMWDVSIFDYYVCTITDTIGYSYSKEDCLSKIICATRDLLEYDVNHLCSEMCNNKINEDVTYSACMTEKVLKFVAYWFIMDSASTSTLRLLIHDTKIKKIMDFLRNNIID